MCIEDNFVLDAIIDRDQARDYWDFVGSFDEFPVDFAYHSIGLERFQKIVAPLLPLIAVCGKCIRENKRGMIMRIKREEQQCEYILFHDGYCQIVTGPAIETLPPNLVLNGLITALSDLEPSGASGPELGELTPKIKSQIVAWIVRFLDGYTLIMAKTVDLAETMLEGVVGEQTNG